MKDVSDIKTFDPNDQFQTPEGVCDYMSSFLPTSMKILPSFYGQIWVGLKEGYDDKKVHTIEDVYRICDEFVNDIKDCVTVTETSFRYVDGFEKGAVVGYINYPRFPRSEDEIRERAIRLAERLMVGLKQYRVTITTPTESILLENENL